MPRCIRLSAAALLVVVFTAAASPTVEAQFPLAQSSSLLEFDGYHDYAASLAFMDHYANTYPDIVEKFSIGESFLGTTVWGVIITNKATGSHVDKSAYWADGNRHSGEVTGAEAVLYTIKYLCENYGKDPVVTDIVDNKVAYPKPCAQPSVHTTATVTDWSMRIPTRISTVMVTAAR